jgi:adenosylcobalamin phosphodiesterase
MRLGTTSFIHPGSWLHNVQRLGPSYDDVEILFFEDHDDGAYPGMAELRELRRCKRELELTYSLHTPLAASLASEDEPRRRQGVASVLRALDVASILEPENIVVHVYHGDGEHTAERPRDLPSWRQRAAESLAALIASGVPAERLCVERLDYDYALIEPVVRELGVSVALDVGHLVRDGADELEELQRWLGQTRIVQWHGTDPSGRDHRSLDHYPLERARSLLRALRDASYAGVLTLEVFREADLASSRALFDRLAAELDPPFPPPVGSRAPRCMEIEEP